MKKKNSLPEVKRLRLAHIILLVTFGLYMLYSRILPYTPFYAYKFPVLLISQCLLFVPGIVVLRAAGRDWAEEIHFRAADGHNIMLGLTALLCAYPAAALLNLFSLLFVENQVTPVAAYMLQFGLGPAIFILAVMPAFAEEFLFRGILYYSYSPLSRTGGMVLSALVFALFHLNLNQFFYAFFLGILFALMAEATGSILVPMIMHFAIDAFNVVLSDLAGAGQGEAPVSGREAVLELLKGLSSPGAVITFVLAVAAILFMLILVVWRTYLYNGRSLAGGKEPAQGKACLIDIFLLLFIGAAVYLTIKNTNFL